MPIQYYILSGWKYLLLSMASIATAMLCKEQGITVAGVCSAYEIFVAQKVRSHFHFIAVDDCLLCNKLRTNYKNNYRKTQKKIGSINHENFSNPFITEKC